MKLTPELLQKIKDIVEKHHQAFAVGVLGPDVFPTEVLEALKDAGLLEDVEALDEKAYLYGQLAAKLEDPAIVNKTLDEVEKELAKNPIPLTDVEKQAIQSAKLNAGIYLTGLSNNVVKDVQGMVQKADQVYRAKVRQGVAANIANRETVKQLKSDLGHATGDWNRNLDRVAITEKHNAMQEGVADGIRKRFGTETLVYVQPQPDACKHCKKLHLGPDGTPRIFKLSQLAPPGANVGQKAENWVATVGSVHPHCQCQLNRMPVGWGFNEQGIPVPGGEFGVQYEGEEFGKAVAAELHHCDELRKAHKLMGNIDFQGLDIAIETGPGSLRFWYDPVAKEEGLTIMQYAYGYIRRTLGVDGDHVDVYVGPNPDASHVYIVHQRKKQPDGSFGGYDEDKCMLGFSSLAHARAAYTAHYDDPRFLDSITTMSMAQFKEELATTRERPRKLTKADVRLVIPNPNYVEPEPAPAAPEPVVKAEPDFRFTLPAPRTRTPVTLIYKSRGEPGSVGGGGANIQMDLPNKPLNPHDVAGVQAFLGQRSAGDDPRVTRDPSVYEYNEAVDWVHPISEVMDNWRNVIVPDETETFAEENREIVEHVSTQVTDSVMNKPAAPHWGPPPYSGPRYPVEDDSDRTIQKGKA